MNFDDVLQDVHKLIGLELRSITGGSSTAITIEDIDDENDRIIIRTHNGKVCSRSVNELRKIWDAMQASPAVHVEQVLGGSGSSRNQPETVLANLPYIEWLRVDKKKHISYVGESSHPYGTLQLMDPAKTAGISDRLKSSNKKSEITAVIVSKDINKSIALVQEVCSGKLSVVEIGVYQLENANSVFVFMSSDTSGIDEGTYLVVDGSAYRQDAQIRRLAIYGQKYSAICNGNIKMMVRDHD